MIGSVRSWGFRELAYFIPVVVAMAVLQGVNGCESKSRDESNASQRKKATTIRLGDEARNDVLTEVATLIRDQYADREIGEALANTILAKLEQGQFDSVVDADSLVSEVMAVIRTKVSDLHFEFSIRGEPDDHSMPSTGGTPSEHGLKTIRMLENDTAYLEFDSLPGDDASMSFVEQSLAELPEVRALIIDTRNNIGGSGDMVVLLCSHLLEAGTFLYDYSDRSDKPPGEMKARSYGRTFSPEVPVYVLTSGATLSAAEALAYILQDYERAKIVGQQTPGMANPSRTFSLGNDFEMTIPFLLLRYGKSRGTFAGVGVAPDKAVPAESALDVAISEISARVQTTKH